MYHHKYLKFFMKVTNPPFTLMITVSLHLVYYFPSRVHLFFSLSFFWRARVELVRSVSGNVCTLKKPGGTKNTHSVFFLCLCVFEAKPREMVREEGDPFLDVRPVFKNKCADIYIKNTEYIKESARYEGAVSVTH